jgi:predicted SAM-dependent methyltransferase
MDRLKSILSIIGLGKPASQAFRVYRQWRSRYKWEELKASRCVWLELGSGAKEGRNGWTTVDLSGADILHDLRKGIPLPNESVDRIYTSHTFEHIPYKELIVFINECHRVLKVGGELSVSVPNAYLYIKAYIEGKNCVSQESAYQPALVDTNSLMDQINYIAYMDGQHHYMFDEQNLINTIRKAPFSSVIKRGFDSSVDLESRDFESIYASAIK